MRKQACAREAMDDGGQGTGGPEASRRHGIRDAKAGAWRGVVVARPPDGATERRESAASGWQRLRQASVQQTTSGRCLTRLRIIKPM